MLFHKLHIPYHTYAPHALRYPALTASSTIHCSVYLQLTPEKADYTAEAILVVLVERFRREAPTSAHLRDPKGSEKKGKKKRKRGNHTTKEVSLEEKYSLVDLKPGQTSNNFKNTLQACFTGDHDSMEAVEVEVYRLAALEHKAFPELAGWPEE